MRYLLVSISAALILAACAPAPTPTPLPTATATPNSGATATANAEANATAQALSTATAQAAAARTRLAEITATAQAVSAQSTATAQSVLAAVDSLTKQANIVLASADGTLPFRGEGLVPAVIANQSLRNLVAEARFFNPADCTVNPWDYGFAFRNARFQDYRLIVDCKGAWRFALSDTTGREGYRSGGSLKNFDGSPTGANHLRVVVKDNLAFFFANGEFVSMLDVSERDVPGPVFIGSGWTTRTKFPGMAPRYRDLAVSSLP